MSPICRFCLKSHSENLDNSRHNTQVFHNIYTNVDFYNKLRECVPPAILTLSENDVLPHSICNHCYNKSKFIFEFFQTIKLNETELKILYDCIESKDKREDKKRIKSVDISLKNGNQKLELSSKNDDITILENEIELFETKSNDSLNNMVNNHFNVDENLIMKTEDNNIILNTKEPISITIESEDEQEKNLLQPIKIVDVSLDNECHNRINKNKHKIKKKKNNKVKEIQTLKNQKDLLARNVWECVICFHKTNVKQKLLWHYEEHFKNHASIKHKESYSKLTKGAIELEAYQCIECQKIYTTLTSMTLHLNENHPTKFQLSCQICHKKFSRSIDMLEHGVTAHLTRNLLDNPQPNNNPSNNCSVLNVSNSSNTLTKTPTKSNLVDLLDENDSFFKCDICNKEFSQYTLLERHILTDHIKETMKKHYCYICKLNVYFVIYKQHLKRCEEAKKEKKSILNNSKS